MDLSSENLSKQNSILRPKLKDFIGVQKNSSRVWRYEISGKGSGLDPGGLGDGNGEKKPELG